MNKIIDQGQDVIEFLTHDQADRTGIACARIAGSLKKGVDPEALAIQLTANERKNNPINPETVTIEDVNSAAKWHRLNSRRQIYSKTVAAELEKAASQADDFNPVLQN
jgi:hypothetical protein